MKETSDFVGIDKSNLLLLGFLLLYTDDLFFEDDLGLVSHFVSNEGGFINSFGNINYFY